MYKGMKAQHEVTFIYYTEGTKRNPIDYFPPTPPKVIPPTTA
jgi:hypothetical protein